MNSQSTKGQEEKQADIICSDHLTKRESGNWNKRTKLRLQAGLITGQKQKSLRSFNLGNRQANQKNESWSDFLEEVQNYLETILFKDQVIRWWTADVVTMLWRAKGIRESYRLKRAGGQKLYKNREPVSGCDRIWTLHSTSTKKPVRLWSNK